MTFQVDTSYSFCVMLQTKYKYEELQRAMTPKSCKRELWFYYTALLLIKIYLPMIFQVDTSYSFCVMLQTKLWQDGWMDERKGWLNGQMEKQKDGQAEKQLK